MTTTGSLVDAETAPVKSEGTAVTINAAAHDESERNPIFDALVTPDGEVSGLVAYSIYKQNKRAWLDDFIKLTGRPPTEAESRAYIIGESTERRLATYRQLASTTLAGAKAAPSRSGGVSLVSGAIWAVIVIAGLAALGFVLRNGGAGLAH